MSCASPIPQLSPSSLHMYNANLDDADPLHLHSPFSFSFSSAPLTPHPHLLSSSPLSPPPPPSRPVLTDILLQRHKNSPKSPLTLSLNKATAAANLPCLGSPKSPLRLSLNKATTAANLPCLGSPRKGYKENWENAGITHRNDVENGGPIDALGPLSSPSALKNKSAGKAQRSDVENGAPMDALNPSPLKRKRPTKLAIPEFARLASFGKAKEFELPEQEPEIHSCNVPLYAVSSKRGRKGCMEDAHTAITNFQGKLNQAFFGVFDGHGGKSAAQFAAENLGRHIDMAIQSQKGEGESLEDAMQAGYLATDSEFLAKGMNGGACSISAFVKEGQLVIANAGDCKAVLCRNGKAEALSTFHRASNLEERQRIENLGGYVDCFNGVWRLQGTLAVTRAFGDMNLKQWVSAEPEIKQLNITHDCEFLILASDGLWDKVSDQEAVDCAREVLRNPVEKDEALNSPVSRPSKAQKHHHSSDPSSANKKSGETDSVNKMDACHKLIHKACTRGNLDDITVMVVPLKDFAMPR